jgi:hypothetical protein
MIRALLNRFRPVTRQAFDHEEAQRFELASAKQTIREAYPDLLRKWREMSARGARWHNADNLWFGGDVELWRRFEAHVVDRKCLEIGSGPFGFLAPATWIRHRIVIDPLIDHYRAYEEELCGESWFSGVRTIAAPAEQVVPDLVSAVDGCIVCQNALDHCEDALAVLDGISAYASPGCWLLLWTDLWHLLGLDEGHHNITRNPSVMDKLMCGLGFEIVRRADGVRAPNEFIEYGRLCIKK